MSLLKFLILAAAVAAASCQWFGDFDNGFIKYSVPLYTGSQGSVTGYGAARSDPFAARGGLDWVNSGGHGISGSVSTVPKSDMLSANIGGRLGLVNTPNEKLFATASHSRLLDENLRTVAKANSAGLRFEGNSVKDNIRTFVEGGVTARPGRELQTGVKAGLAIDF